MRYLTVEQKLEHLKEGLGYLPIDPANHPLGKWSLYDAKIVSDVFSEMCEVSLIVTGLAREGRCEINP